MSNQLAAGVARNPNGPPTLYVRGGAVPSSTSTVTSPEVPLLSRKERKLARKKDTADLNESIASSVAAAIKSVRDLDVPDANEEARLQQIRCDATLKRFRQTISDPSFVSLPDELQKTTRAKYASLVEISLNI